MPERRKQRKTDSSSLRSQCPRRSLDAAPLCSRRIPPHLSLSLSSGTRRFLSSRSESTHLITFLCRCASDTEPQRSTRRISRGRAGVRAVYRPIVKTSVFREKLENKSFPLRSPRGKKVAAEFRLGLSFDRTCPVLGALLCHRVPRVLCVIGAVVPVFLGFWPMHAQFCIQCNITRAVWIYCLLSCAAAKLLCFKSDFTSGIKWFTRMLINFMATQFPNVFLWNIKIFCADWIFACYVLSWIMNGRLWERRRT